MNEPTTSDVLAEIQATREADQKTRLAQLLLAVKYVGLFAAALTCPTLVVLVVMSR